MTHDTLEHATIPLHDIMGDADVAVGIDVSTHQKQIDWGEVRGAGALFANSKASQGTDIHDSTFTEHVQGAHDAGLLLGAYHLCEMNPGASSEALASARAEADIFLEMLRRVAPIAPLPIVDLETRALTRHTASNPDGAAGTAAWLRAFLDALESATRTRAMIYLSRHAFDRAALGDHTAPLEGRDLWWKDYPGADAFPLTSASAPDVVAGWAWRMWQCTRRGAVPGVAGDVDVDVFNGDAHALERWHARASSPG